MRVGGRGAAGIAAAAGAAAEGRSEAVKAAVYAAIDRVGRGAIAAELRGDAGAGRGSGGPVDRAVRIAAGSAGLPGLRGGGGAGCAGCAGGGDAAAALTALLHYMLSAASVPSQRRVAVRGEEIDIVVPDVAGLPAAVAVCIVGEAGGDRAEARAAAAAAALGLPRRRVWVAGWSRAASPAAAASGGREYLASDGSLALLVRDLAAFAASPAAAGGGGRGRGRRLGLLGNAAGA